MTGMIIEGKTAKWEVICGLEIHCQLLSKSKMFSGASTHYGADPNENVSFVDAGMPGMLPTLNEMCVRQAVKTGMGLNAVINKYSEFARKNYFYADLPQGYQISQFKYPLVGEGSVTVDLSDGTSKEIGIERIHIEQDAGKSIHDISPDKSFIDLNRAGVGLMEIVTHPDFRSPEEAGAFLRKLRSIVRYLGTCDGNMDEGSMRCDVNVSVRKVGETEYRTRNEMKNVNSVKFVMQAIESEAHRHVETYENGGEICQETRQFDPATGTTRVMRKKEFAHDYRYFPEPDLLPLVIDDAFIEEIKSEMVELPDAKKEYYKNTLGLTDYVASVLCENRETAEFFERALGEKIIAKDDNKQFYPRGFYYRNHGEASKIANWIMGDFFAILKIKKIQITESLVKPEHIAKLVQCIEADVINGKIAKEVFAIMAETGEDPEVIIDTHEMRQSNMSDVVESFVDEVIASSPDNVAAYKDGKVALMGWFVGQVMKKSGGKANPGVVNALLTKKLV